jgi:hypothetical protein
LGSLARSWSALSMHCVFVIPIFGIHSI